MTARPALAWFGMFAIVTASILIPRATHAAGLGPLPASFSGVLPCADCMGLRHQLNLFPRGAFILALSYFRDGRDDTFYELGEYMVSPDSTVVSLATHDPQGTRFSIQPDGGLRLLDRDGQTIDSQLDYDLRREATLLPIEPRLLMRGSYYFMADAGVFTDCRSGMTFPVAPGDGAYQLEKAFMEEQAIRELNARAGASSSKSGKPAKGSKTKAATSSPTSTPEPQELVVAIHGRIAVRPPAGMEGVRPTLIVEHFVESFPNETCGARGVTHALEGTRWVLMRIGSDPVRLGPKQREIFMALDSKTSRVSGYSGCNRFSSAYTTDKSDDGKITFGPAAGTKAPCSGPDYEWQLYRALELTRTYKITGAHLELLDPAGDVLARFESRNL